MWPCTRLFAVPHNDASYWLSLGTLINKLTSCQWEEHHCFGLCQASSAASDLHIDCVTVNSVVVLTLTHLSLTDSCCWKTFSAVAGGLVDLRFHRRQEGTGKSCFQYLHVPDVHSVWSNPAFLCGAWVRVK